MARYRPHERRLMSQINVTPLVDVMLVLLIIFMVTTPMMQAGVDVSLPKVESAAIRADEEPIVITIDRKRRFYINDRRVKRSKLRFKLRAIHRLDAKRNVLLRADAAVPYGYVMDAMSDIRKAGISNVGMVTEPPGAAR